jgi:hypothetical protein
VNQKFLSINLNLTMTNSATLLLWNMILLLLLNRFAWHLEGCGAVHGRSDSFSLVNGNTNCYTC